MKKILVLLSLLLPGVAFGVGQVWRSSHTKTVETGILCTARQTGQVNRRGVLHSVCVNDGGTSGTIAVHDSSATANNAFAVIRASAAYGSGCKVFDIATSSGLVYVTDTLNNDVTFTFDCF